MDDATQLSGVEVVARADGSRVRQPRGAIKVNGVEMRGWIEFEVETNSLYDADVFSCSFAVSDLPAEYGAAWWASQEKIEVEVFAGFPSDLDRFSSADLDSVFFGRADDVDWDLAVGTLQVNGRDLTADLIDSKTTEKFPNLTASKIAEKLAAAHGLEPVVTATTAKVGRYYQTDHVKLQSTETAWDLLTVLAREEGFVVYVSGRELHFEPPPEAGQEPYEVVWTPPGNDGGPPAADAVGLSFSRSLTIAKGIRVTVRSWNGKQKKAYTKTATRKGGEDVQEYSYSIPNLTPEETQQRANKILAEKSAQEMRLEMSGPADNTLRISDVIKVSGTGAAFDQIYYPETIVRTLDRDGGYAMQVSAKNHSVESTPTL